MKKTTSVLSLLIIQVFLLIGCRYSSDINKINLSKSTNNNYKEVQSLMNEIHWEQWETTPIKVEKIIIEDYHKKWEGAGGFYYIYGSYPKIIGLTDQTFIKQVNDWIKEPIEKDLSQFKNDFESFTNKIGKEGIEKGASITWRYSCSYKVLLFNSQIISIMFETDNTGNTTRDSHRKVKTVNIDLIQKKKLTENELFIPNSNYLETLKPYMAKQIIEQFNIIMKIPHAINDDYFDNHSVKEIKPYLHFGLSPNHLIISFDQTGEFGLNTLFIIKVPYSEIKNILPFKEFKNSYSYLAYPENWNVYERIEIKDPGGSSVGENLLIKYPEIKAQTGKTSNFEVIEDGIKIAIPIGINKATIQINWKEMENEYLKPPNSNLLKPTEKEKLEPTWAQIDGVWFKKNRTEKDGTIEFQGAIFTTEYTIKIQMPASNTEKNKKEIIKRINQVFGTLRLG